MSNDLDKSLSVLTKLKDKPDVISRREWRTMHKTLKKASERKDFSPEEQRAVTQSDLAKQFMKYYFEAMLFVLLFALLYNVAVGNFVPGGSKALIKVDSLFTLVSTAITPIFTFVLGHFFKGKD